jgi:PHD/YefM family antitoxin component YafN of YafNO toxin-antitoxin module
MEVVNYTYARQNLKTVMDDCAESGEPTVIISKKNQVVMISKSKYYDMVKVISKVSSDGE